MVPRNTGSTRTTAILGVAGALLISAGLAGTGAISGGFAALLAAVLLGVVALVMAGRSVVTGKEPLRAARACTVLVLAFVVPVAFDRSTAEVFNLLRYTLVVLGALLIGVLWIIGGTRRRRIPFRRSGLEWPLAAIVVWTAISAVSGVDPHIGLLGAYGSYDGLYLAMALAVIALATAEAFDPTNLDSLLGVFAFVGGGMVAFYGLLQLRDTLFGGSRWDPFSWHATSFGKDIFATFGNPNHLGGFLAMILPIVVLAAMLAKRLFIKVLFAVFGAVVLLELLRTAARGAWVAAIVSVLVFGVMLLPEIRRRPAISVGASTSLAFVVIVGMFLAGRKLLHEPLSQLFRSGGVTPVQQRFDMWNIAFHVGVAHPLTGVGPDSYALVFPQHVSQAWVKGLGASYVANGAHDIFLNILADQGFIGLLLFLALLVVVSLRTLGAWRRLRGVEASNDEEHLGAARHLRWLLAALSASIVAYLVQASFDVQQVGLSFGFFFLLGASAVIASAAGVPDSLSPRRMLSLSSGMELVRLGDQPYQRVHRARRAPTDWTTVLVGLPTLVVAGLLTWGAIGPYRADRAFQAAMANARVILHGSSSTAHHQYATDMERALALNPWEASYPAAAAQLLFNSALAGHESSASAKAPALSQSATLYRQAYHDAPLVGPNAYGLALAEFNLSRVQPGQVSQDLRLARSAIGKAVSDNPFQPNYRQLRSQIERAITK